MNRHDPAIEAQDSEEISTYPTEAEAKEALSVRRRWAARQDETAFADASPNDAARRLAGGTHKLARDYDTDFTVDAAYINSLPDLQNGPASLIRGARAPIQHVGISNFRLPLRYQRREGGTLTLETGVTGTVSLEADKKGINMSRIMRSFYRHGNQTFSYDTIDAALADYVADLGSLDARIQMNLSYPMHKPSLRSGLEGYQYYDIALETSLRAGTRSRILHLDYVYSSTCPCSLELSEHARDARARLATPHSQRSVARLSLEVLDGETLWFEDVVDMCRNAVPTETQVMVKREDEQAFAELNAANPIFVEDAARLFYAALDADPRVGDFRVLASHQESLHSHDAVSVLTSGALFADHSLDPKLFSTLIHRG